MISTKLKRVFDLHRLGLKSGQEDDVTRRISFSNVVFITLPIVYLIFMGIDYETFINPSNYEMFDVFIVPIVVLLCLFCLWLNKIYFTFVSRILFLAVWPFLLHLLPIKLQATPIDYYLAFPMGCIFHSMLIQLMLSHRREAVFFWIFNGTNLFVSILTPEILTFFVAYGVEPNPLVFDPYYRLDIVLYWLLFNLVMFYILLVIERYIRTLNTAKTLIEHQKQELETLNQLLESKVSSRTRALNDKNKKLLSYAFYNAHLLRAPFCRIQGLMNLMNMEKAPSKENNEVLNRLNESVDELEVVIESIRQIVHMEENEIDSELSEPDGIEMNP